MSELRAIGLVLFGMTCFALQDVVVKLTADAVSLWQMQAVRSIAVLGILVVLTSALGRRRELVPTRWRWPLIRGALMTGSYLLFYAAIPYASLAKVASAFFIGPLLITLFAALLLGEPIGPRRIAAVAAGFAGVLCIVQPGLAGWNPAALLPVGAAVCYALAVVLTRWRCREDPGFSLTVAHNLIYTAVGLAGVFLIPLVPFPEELRTARPFLTEGWFPLALPVLALLIVTAGTHVAGILSTVRAYQMAEASRLAPFEYVYLVVMGTFDYLFWDQVPAPLTLAGMALICGAGGFVAWREGRPARPRMQQSAEIPWTPDHARDGDDAPLGVAAELPPGPARPGGA